MIGETENDVNTCRKVAEIIKIYLCNGNGVMENDLKT